MSSVAILATGSELLDGRVLDTNSRFLAEKLSDFGLTLSHILTCGDEISDIVKALKYLEEFADFIVISGGLGPTTDDLTREAVADLIGCKLVNSDQALEHLKSWYKSRGRELDPGNLKQATFPDGAEIIPNPVGTAPGFLVNFKSGKYIAAIPGVPKEFKVMLTETVLPKIQKTNTSSTLLKKSTFKFFGIPESTLGRLISASQIPDEVSVSYRAVFPEVHVTLKTKGSSEVLSDAENKVLGAVDNSALYSRDSGLNFVGNLSNIIRQRKLTLSCAESCTAGHLGALFTSESGASSFYYGGVISYCDQVKIKLLGVSKDTLTKHGAVSLETAKEMAFGVRKLCGSDYSLSITGIAGPDGGTEEKPVGTFCVGIATPHETKAVQFRYVSDREGIRRYSAFYAMDILRRELLGLTLAAPS